MNKQNILFGVLATLLLGVTGYFAFRPRISLPDMPLRSVPDSAILVAHADVATLTRAPAFRQLMEASGDQSIGRLRELCGFNPLDAIREATLFVSEGGNLSPQHIGVVLRGRVGAGDLGACLRRAVENDGGSVRNQQIEGFPAVVSSGGGSRAVFVGDDGFVEGAEAPVLASLHAANGTGGSAASNATLNDLWEKLGSDRELSILSRVPNSWHEPLNALAARQQLPALSHLVALGLGLRVSTGVTAAAIVRASAAEHARALATAITAYKDELARTPFIGFTPFGPALAHVRIEAQGNDVVLAADLTVEQIRAALDLLQGGADGVGPMPDARRPAPTAPAPPSAAVPQAASPTPAAEEIVRARQPAPATP